MRGALEFSFEIAPADTLLAGSTLVAKELPVQVYCAVCAQEVELQSVQRFRCPQCDTPSGDICQGRELEVASIELELPTEAAWRRRDYEDTGSGDSQRHSEQERRDCTGSAGQAAGVRIAGSQPGFEPRAVKTALLQRTLREQGHAAAALVGDLATDNDARTLAGAGVPVKQINTDGFGWVTAQHPGMLTARTAIGGTRIIPLQIGEQIPRIC